MSTAKQTREAIHGQVATMDYDLRTLELWEQAETQGIDSSDGGAFGLDTRRFTKAQRQEYHWHTERFAKGRKPKVFNYFRYPDGRTVTLDPMLTAVHR
jgi:hypothetical protein